METIAKNSSTSKKPKLQKKKIPKSTLKTVKRYYGNQHEIFSGSEGL